MIRTGLSLVFAIGLGISAYAEDGAKDTIKLEDVTPSNSISNADEIDQLITNKNLRALSGSKSRWSFGSTFSYNGGSLQKPFSEDRPNIAEASAITSKSDLSGNVSGKFNINVQNSLSGGVGVRWIAPLTKGRLKNYQGSRTDAQNPYLMYQYLYNVAGVESVVQFYAIHWTQSDMTAIGYDKDYTLSQDSVYSVGDTGLSVGASMWASLSTFDKAGEFKSEQGDYQFGLDPVVEYEISDNLYLRTTLSPWVFEHYRDTRPHTYIRNKTYQSVGVGYSITRDIELYPNIQFLPEKLIAKSTNVGIEATVNLF